MEAFPPIAGVLLERSALATGFLAAAIAVGGFVTRTQALLRLGPKAELQRPAAIGGVHGLAFGLLIIVIDAWAG